MCKCLVDKGAKMIVVTGINVKNKLINFVYEEGKNIILLKLKKLVMNEVELVMLLVVLLLENIY